MEYNNLSVYLAGSMDKDSSETHTWRASVAECGDIGTDKYTEPTPVEVNSPEEVMSCHGCGIVKDIAGKDMELVDQSDAIVAYFDKEEQIGTLTELVYAVTEGKPALVLFDRDLVPRGSPSNGVNNQGESPVYWFLINFLTEDSWEGLDADVTVRVVESRDEIRDAYWDWNWHKSVVKARRELERSYCAKCAKYIGMKPVGEGPSVCDECFEPEYATRGDVA